MEHCQRRHLLNTSASEVFCNPAPVHNMYCMQTQIPPPKYTHNITTRWVKNSLNCCTEYFAVGLILYWHHRGSIICFIVEFMLVCFNKRSHGWPSYCSLSTHLSCSASDHISFCLYASSLFYWVYRTFVSSSGQFLSFCHIWPLIPEQIPLNIIIEMYGVLIYF